MSQQDLTQRDGESIEDYSRRLAELVEANNKSGQLEDDDPENASVRKREVTSETGANTTILPRVPRGANKAADVDLGKPFPVEVTDDTGSRLVSGIHDPILHGKALDPNNQLLFAPHAPKKKEEQEVVDDVKKATEVAKKTYQPAEADKQEDTTDTPAPKKRRRRSYTPKAPQTAIRPDAQSVSVTFKLSDDVEFEVNYADSLAVGNLLVFITEHSEKGGFQPKPSETAMILSVSGSVFRAYLVGTFQYGTLQFTLFMVGGDAHV